MHSSSPDACCLQMATGLVLIVCAWLSDHRQEKTKRVTNGIRVRKKGKGTKDEESKQAARAS
jgi:hypothetical protein